MASPDPEPDRGPVRHWPDAPMRPRTRRNLAIAVPLILALAGAVLAGRWVQADRQTDAPVATVRAFLEAVRSGEVETALAMTASEPSASTALLVPEALDADWEIADLGLGRWVSAASTAEVWATIRGPEGTEVTAEFELDPEGDDWKITDPFSTLHLPQLPLPYIEVNGHKVDYDPEAEDALGFVVLPGVYRLYGDPPELLAYDHGPMLTLGHRWSDPDGTRIFDQGTTFAAAGVFKGFSVAEGIEPALGEQVAAYLDACFADPEGPELFGCPFGFEERYLDLDGVDLGAVRGWEIVEYPQVAAVSYQGPIVGPFQIDVLDRVPGLARVTVADANSGADVVLECTVATSGLYLWLDESGQYAIGPNGDPNGPDSGAARLWEEGYRADCEPAP
ncbi:hypothetical protein [Glycomyces sp. NRRL B-16210]|uniref:hypothetical protein n=1 Tax=Glycomyces sp. NRRL B-16210 TaxID=1463821 RepID=UPI0004C1EA3E|nr:hypothetical protein [Glycomyces sp. NRRL B-16210]